MRRPEIMRAQAKQKREEWFQKGVPPFICFYYITAAERILLGRPITGEVAVADLYRDLLASRQVYVDRLYAMSDAVDTNRPVIFASRQNGERILIDGHHRLYKAYHTGVAQLPYKQLSVEETGKIEIPVLVPRGVDPLIELARALAMGAGPMQRKVA
jgi:hypothetical protein